MRLILLIALLFSFDSVAQIHTGTYHGRQYKKKKGEYSWHVQYYLKSNLKDGHWKFFEIKEDTILRHEAHFVNRKIHGVEKTYWFDGSLRCVNYYSNGIPDSTWIEYHPSGYILTINNYKNGKLNGLQTYYRGDGGGSFETFEYVNGIKEGISREYWRADCLHSETVYKNDERHGLHTEWHCNGQMSIQGNYYPFTKYDARWSTQNRTGEWKFWNENGELIQTEIWKKEKLISIKEYISANDVSLPPDSICLVGKGCFGKYCLGDIIHTHAIKNSGSVGRGKDLVYNNYSGDSLDQIILEPSEIDTSTIHRMFTISPRFRTVNGIGVGSTIQDIIDSGENVRVISSANGRPSIYFIATGIRAGLDENTCALFYNSDRSADITQLRPEGFITFLELED